jgi:DNA (cytosine-5)-methyltransferase 1
MRRVLGMAIYGQRVAHRLDRLKALGNGQVPRVAAAAFELLRREE